MTIFLLGLPIIAEYCSLLFNDSVEYMDTYSVMHGHRLPFVRGAGSDRPELRVPKLTPSGAGKIWLELDSRNVGKCFKIFEKMAKFFAIEYKLFKIMGFFI